jgi:hypothetical protein
MMLFSFFFLGIRMGDSEKREPWPHGKKRTVKKGVADRWFPTFNFSRLVCYQEIKSVAVNFAG